jgi:uncharacterized membrane protein YjfL (UPF0719 family)
MSEDEVFVFLISCVVAAVAWLGWYFRWQTVARLRRDLGTRLVVAGMPVLCAVLLWLVLRHFAAHDVRNAPVYLAFYAVLGAAWVGLGVRLIAWCGVSVRDDVLERRNSAATWAAAGALVGLTLCFAGANIGDGPGWWVVVYSASLSTMTLFALWACLERLTHVSEAVTVERDVASGLRLGGFLAAAGLILGRAVAGDWVSAGATNVEFVRMAWPVIVLLLLAVPVDRFFRPSADQPAPAWLLSGLPPVAIFVGGAIVWVALIGL